MLKLTQKRQKNTEKMILKNNKEVSGMFSNAGRISYERYHVFHKKDEILNPDERKKKVIPYVNVVEQLVSEF